MFFRFGRQEKDCIIQKSKDPGPGSYEALETVGVIQGYNFDEKIPRNVFQENKAMTIEQKKDK